MIVGLIVLAIGAVLSFHGFRTAGTTTYLSQPAQHFSMGLALVLLSLSFGRRKAFWWTSIIRGHLFLGLACLWRDLRYALVTLGCAVASVTIAILS